MQQFNIALIEGDSDQREILHSCLVKDGFQVWSVPNEDAFYKLAFAIDFNVVIVDLDLPGEDGLATIGYLKEHKEISVIATSAIDRLSEYRKASELGVERYFLKPVMPEELSAHLLQLYKRVYGHAVERSEPIWHLLTREKILKAPDNASIRLTVSELLILRVLLESNDLISKADVVVKLGGNPAKYDYHRLDVHISRLRNKIKKNTHTPFVLSSLPGQRLQLLTRLNLL